MTGRRKPRKRVAKIRYPPSEKGLRVALTRARNNLSRARAKIAQFEQGYAEIGAITRFASRLGKRAMKA